MSTARKPWRVPFIDYPTQYGKVRDELLETVDEMLLAGDVMMRQQLTDFEEHLAEYCGTRYAVGVSNCTDALHLTLRAAGIGPGDEVISVSHTFVATIAAIHHAGATPVLVDIGDDHNIDVDRIEPAITPRCKAILPVHLNGRVSDMGRVLDIAKRHGLLVIEDAAQSLGASFQGVRGGAAGLAGCFSFYPAKLIGTYGDAGAVVTDSEEIAEKLRLLRNHGRTADGDIAFWSFNCRMDNLHAAILDLKLSKYDEVVARRRELAGIYAAELEGTPGLRLPPGPVDPMPGQAGARFDVFQNYEIEAADRDGLRAHLTENGVETLVSWGGRGVHQFPALGLGEFDLPRTEELFEHVLMLPLHAELSDDQVRWVARLTREHCRDTRLASSAS